MRPTRLAAFAAAMLVATLAHPAAAQSLDGMRWSLFAGQTISHAAGADRSFGFPAENFGVGGGLDFRLRYVPVDLRATVARLEAVLLETEILRDRVVRLRREEL